MPTYESAPRFLKAHRDLTAREKQEFRRAVELFIEGLHSATGRFHPSLRVHRLGSTADVWSLTWGKRGKGRATFRFGQPVRQGDPHIEWLGVTADHSLYKG